MKTSDSRDILINKIEKYLSNISPAKTQELEEEIRHDDKITMGDFYKLLSGRFSLAEASDAELYWITVAISNSSKRFGKPEDFFEEAEIQNYKYYDNFADNNKYKKGIVFHDVIELADGQYMFPLSVGEIKELKNSNLLQVVPELQRNYKKDKYGELKTKVSKRTAQEISQLIDNKIFFFNGIRFNLMDDGDANPPIYDEEKRTLTVTSGTIIVPDGNHRTIACELATKNLTDKFGVFFTYLNATQTRRVLNQEWTTVPIPKRHKDAMKQTPSNLVLDSIIRSPDADELYVNNIVKDGMEIKTNHGFILYSELSDAIATNYDMSSLRTKADQDELRDWLITFMNYLTKIMYDDFSNFASVKRTRWSVHYLAWYFYIMISANVWKKPEWKEILEKMIDNTDFDDKEIRKFCTSLNRRKFIEYCRGREEELCTMLK